MTRAVKLSENVQRAPVERHIIGEGRRNTKVRHIIQVLMRSYKKSL
jgi:hypothetical protein